MSWNYRMFKETYESHGISEEYITMREVYYKEDGVTPRAYSSDAVAPRGTDINELSISLKHMDDALHKPILTIDDFNGSSEG